MPSVGNLMEEKSCVERGYDFGLHHMFLKYNLITL
jgi:hypothetical protein